MSKITRTGIDIIKLVIITIIFVLLQILIYQYINPMERKTEIDMEIMDQREITMPVEEIAKEDAEIWQLEIKKISLVADISDGTTKEILNKYIGHFEETKTEEGNIGLAAHNRGYDVNYFEKLKLLKEGDLIEYKHNQYSKTYEVTRNIIIKDTDWQYLEDTEDNMLTLITCVENEPNYRRCIQGVEFE